MWYKEWLGARTKFYLVLSFYLVTGLLLFFIWRSEGSQPVADKIQFFSLWTIFNIAITFVAGVLAGSDIVSDEVSKETISFLLSRSFTRRQIYLTKLLINMTLMVVAYLIGNLVVFLLDWLNPVAAENVMSPLNLWGIGAVITLTLLFGIMVNCLSGWFSVLTRETLQTVVLTTAVILGTTLFLAVVFSNTPSQSVTQISQLAWLTVTVVSFVILTLSFFWAGLISFTRKEF